MLRFTIAAAMALAAPVSAAVTPIGLTGLTNGHWTDQGFIDIPTGAATFGGTPFLIDGNGNDALYWTAAFNGSPVTLTVPVSIFGATTAFTLINTFWGTPNQSFQSVTFNATGGVSATFSLFGDVDVRDFQPNTFSNLINNTTSTQVFTSGSRYLDRQTYTLPTSFANQTLTSVVFTDTGADGVSRLTLTGLAIASVPEPSSWAMLIVGFGLVGATMRRRIVAAA